MAAWVHMQDIAHAEVDGIIVWSQTAALGQRLSSAGLSGLRRWCSVTMCFLVAYFTGEVAGVIFKLASRAAGIGTLQQTNTFPWSMIHRLTRRSSRSRCRSSTALIPNNMQSLLQLPLGL